MCVWPICGLSPRVRGNRSGRAGQVSHPGSIPACAGEPRSETPPRYNPAVYPRVCGGTLGGSHVETPFRGLSPRVRGNPKGGCMYESFMRSIPACAGEPNTWLAFLGLAAVYPRVCGGTREALSSNGADKGLSPRVRGNLKKTVVHGKLVGSIPACAGEPLRLEQYHGDNPVYPRVCGGTLLICL